MAITKIANAVEATNLAHSLSNAIRARALPILLQWQEKRPKLTRKDGYSLEPSKLVRDALAPIISEELAKVKVITDKRNAEAKGFNSSCWANAYINGNADYRISVNITVEIERDRREVSLDLIVTEGGSSPHAVVCANDSWVRKADYTVSEVEANLARVTAAEQALRLAKDACQPFSY